MVINKATLDAIGTNFSTIFNNTFGQYPDRTGEIATIAPVDSGTVDFPMAALGSDLREWLGDRVITNLAAYSKQLAIKDFEKTVGVPRNAILDDQLGLYESSIRNLAEVAASYRWRAIVDALMTDGFDTTITTFDGYPFFSASHTWAGGYTTAQDNHTTENLDSAAVWTAIQFFHQVKGPDGIARDYEARSPNAKFICAADLESTARGLFLNERDAAGASNTLYGWFKENDIIVSGRITAERWAILYTGGAIKPVVLANRQDPVFTAMAEPTDELAFTAKLYRYGVDCRFRAYALGWWMGYGSTGAE